MKEIYVVLDSLPIQKPSMMLFDTGMHLLLLVVILTVTQFAGNLNIKKQSDKMPYPNLFTC